MKRSIWKNIKQKRKIWYSSCTPKKKEAIKWEKHFIKRLLMHMLYYWELKEQAWKLKGWTRNHACSKTAQKIWKQLCPWARVGGNECKYNICKYGAPSDGYFDESDLVYFSVVEGTSVGARGNIGPAGSRLVLSSNRTWEKSYLISIQVYFDLGFSSNTPAKYFDYVSACFELRILPGFDSL